MTFTAAPDSTNPNPDKYITAGFSKDRQIYATWNGALLMEAGAYGCASVGGCMYVYDSNSHLASSTDIISANALCTGEQKWILCK